jgi:hypothetical protein
MRYAHLAPSHVSTKAELVTFKLPIASNVVEMKKVLPKYLPNIEDESLDLTKPENHHKFIKSFS